LVKRLKSKYDYDETIKRIKEAIVNYGWSVPAEHNMEDKVNKKIYIIELCNKELASKVLSNEKNYWVSSMMPCRLSVCKEKDGVYIYTMNMKLMLNFLPFELKNVFKEVIETEEKILKEVTS